ncbi:hypothetical protein [Ascidiimonas sp. W6]|uniref:hypothetical protein n=1 Tax=Ascidiimonas meishanensis TaxID=3128903 RepID=UPI0030ED2B42
MKSISLLFFMFFLLGIKGQNLEYLYKESLKAYEAKDYQKFKDLNLKAIELNPSQPTFLYNLAVGYALTDEEEEAMIILKRLLTWNAALKYQEDKNLNALLSDDDYSNILSSERDKYKALTVSSNSFGSFSDSFHLEDLVKIGSRFFFTDVHSGNVYQYDSKLNKTTLLVQMPLSALGIIKGDKSNEVWISTAKLAQFKNKNQSPPRPFICKVNVDSGAIVDKIALPQETIVGSMVLGENNMLYASNSATPEILVIDILKKEIVKTIRIMDGVNLQGLTLDRARGQLFVADYVKGILIVELENDNNMMWLTSKEYLLKGIDGLYNLSTGKLLAIQNNSTPKRVVKIMYLNDQVLTVDLLDNGLKVKGEPTNGFYEEELGFYYITNSQWPFYDKENKPLYKAWEKQQIRLIPVEKL